MSTGIKSSEMKVTAVAGGGAVLPLFLDMMQKGGEGMSEPMKITLIAAIVLMVVSYNVSRGMAKYEHRNGAPPSPAPPKPPSG